MSVNKTEIKSQIGELEKQLDIIGTRQTEVYARIVGYYRSVKNWNRGKKEEYSMRTPYVENSSQDHFLKDGAIDYTKKILEKSSESDSLIKEQPELLLKSEEKNHSDSKLSFLFFQRKTCPNCPPMKRAVSEAEIFGEEIDVDTEAGLESAKEFNVFSAPTVIFLDEAKKEVFRTDSPDLLKSFVTKEVKTGV